MTSLDSFFRTVCTCLIIAAVTGSGCTTDSEGLPAEPPANSSDLDSGARPSTLLISIVTRHALNKEQRVYGSTARLSIGTEWADGSFSSQHTETKPDTSPMGARDGIIDFEMSTVYLSEGKTVIAEVSAAGFENLTVRYKLSLSDPNLIKWPSQYSLVLYCYLNPKQSS